MRHPYTIWAVGVHHKEYFYRSECQAQGHHQTIDAAWSSVAVIAIVPLQDLLNLDSSARMNLPGRAAGNWGWRFTPDAINSFLVARLLEATTIYGRDPALYEGKGDEAGGQSGQDAPGAGAIANKAAG